MFAAVTDEEARSAGAMVASLPVAVSEGVAQTRAPKQIHRVADRSVERCRKCNVASQLPEAAIGGRQVAPEITFIVVTRFGRR